VGNSNSDVRGNEKPTYEWRNSSTQACDQEISGLIERVTFHNDEGGFCVLRVKTPGHRREATVIGALPSVTAG
jgi:hypothetical protein